MKIITKKLIKTKIGIPVIGECVSEYYDAYKCPRCNKVIFDNYGGCYEELKDINYCCRCGQKVMVNK